MTQAEYWMLMLQTHFGLDWSAEVFASMYDKWPWLFP